MKTITVSNNTELVNHLRSIGTACQFISLDTETVVKMRKTNNPFLGTVKVSRRSGLVNVDHEARVNRRMAEAGVDPTFVGGTTWYTHETTTDGKTIPVCVSKKDPEAKYLQFYPHRTRDTRYVLNGRELTSAEVEQMKSFIPDKDYGDFKQPVIVLKMDSIRKARFRGLRFAR